MLDDVRLVAIAGPPLVDPSRLVDACCAAEAGGATAVQLRLKRLPAARLVELSEALRRALQIPVYVNDRADVALAAGAHGVHVGAEDLPPRAVRAFAGDALRIGISVGDEVEAAQALLEPVDYWSIGSVFATSTKPDAGTPIGPEGFHALAALAPKGMTVIAIGGIVLSNVNEVLAAGAHGVAVSRGVFGESEVEQAARRLRDAIDRSLPA
jgi:thiamine-phosphate pyrophosphorylase